MTHDPLCKGYFLQFGGGESCNCDLIAKVRAESKSAIAAAERKGGPEHIDDMLSRAYEEGFESGQGDMLTKCIAAINDFGQHTIDVEMMRDWLFIEPDLVAAIEALGEQ